MEIGVEDTDKIYNRPDSEIKILATVTDTIEHRIFIIKYLIDEIESGHIVGSFTHCI